MITRNIVGKRVLRVFENFQTDTSLKKYQKVDKNDSVVLSNVFADNSLQWTIAATPGTMVTGNIGWGGINSNGMTQSEGVIERKLSFFQRLKKWYVNRRLVSPEVIFAQIIKGQKELEDGLSLLTSTKNDLPQSDYGIPHHGDKKRNSWGDLQDR